MTWDSARGAVAVRASGGPGRRTVRESDLVAGDPPATLDRVGPWGAAGLLGLGYVGYFKGTPLLAWLPVDVTAVFAAACAIGIVLQVLRGRTGDGRVMVWAVGLWGVFGVGAVLTIDTGRDGSKTLLLGTLTLLTALAPGYLLRSARAWRWWLWWTVGAAGVMAVASVAMPDPMVQVQGGRLTLDGASTIGTARVIGAGVLVAVVFALAGAGRRWLWWSMAVAGTVAVVAVGSRGPVVALVLSVAAVVLLARVFKGARARPLGVGTLAVTVLGVAITISSARPAGRLADFVRGERTDVAREFLLREAWHGVLQNPLGVGWGGFSELTWVYSRYAGRPVYPHNLTLEIFLEGGWLAGAAFLVLAFLSIRNYFRASDTPELAALFGLGVYWLVVAQTSSDINGNRMTWISLSLGLMVAVEGSPGRALRHGRSGTRPKAVGDEVRGIRRSAG